MVKSVLEKKPFVPFPLWFPRESFVVWQSLAAPGLSASLSQQKLGWGHFKFELQTGFLEMFKKQVFGKTGMQKVCFQPIMHRVTSAGHNDYVFILPDSFLQFINDFNYTVKIQEKYLFLPWEKKKPTHIWLICANICTIMGGFFKLKTKFKFLHFCRYWGSLSFGENKVLQNLKMNLKNQLFPLKCPLGFCLRAEINEFRLREDFSGLRERLSIKGYLLPAFHPCPVTVLLGSRLHTRTCSYHYFLPTFRQSNILSITHTQPDLFLYQLWKFSQLFLTHYTRKY